MILKKTVTYFSIFPLIFLFCLTLSCQEQRSKLDVEADVAAINELVDNYVANINSGDLEQWMSLWAGGGVDMPPNTPAVVGKENIRAKMQPVFDQFQQEMTNKTEEVKVDGDLAFARGNYAYRLIPKEGGETIEGNGKWLSILVRQDDGSWKFARDIYNDSTPLPSEE
jgi:uncharacterized protein (TIGR02246 family)